MFAERSAALFSVALTWAALGLALVFVSLVAVADATSGDRWWSLGVLALGLANAVPAAGLGAFVLRGREIVVVGPMRLTWRREAFGMGVTRTFEGPVNQVFNRGIRLSGAQSFLVFQIGTKMVRLGTGMTEDEAVAVVGELRDRYPELRPQGFVPRRPRMP